MSASEILLGKITEQGDKVSTTSLTPCPPLTSCTPLAPCPPAPLTSSITQVRVAKGAKATKDEIKPLIDELLKLKADYKDLTGEAPPAAAPAPKKEKPVQPGESWAV